MKKTILLLAVVATVLAGCNNSADQKEMTTDMIQNPESASETGADAPLAGIAFESDVFDFGTISQGEKVSHTFKFTNDGEADLVIVSAKGSCGCTVPKWPKEPIPPGGSGQIDVVFSSENKSGKQHKKVTIVANTHPSTSVIALKGEVIAPEEN